MASVDRSSNDNWGVNSPEKNFSQNKPRNNTQESSNIENNNRDYGWKVGNADDNKSENLGWVEERAKEESGVSENQSWENTNKKHQNRNNTGWNDRSQSYSDRNNSNGYNKNENRHEDSYNQRHNKNDRSDRNDRNDHTSSKSNYCSDYQGNYSKEHDTRNHSEDRHRNYQHDKSDRYDNNQYYDRDQNDRPGYGNSSKSNNYGEQSYRNRSASNEQNEYQDSDTIKPKINYEPPKSGWASDKRRYEYNEESEQSDFKRDEKLEEELFGSETNLQSGINFKEYGNIPVKIIGKEQISPINSFADAKINPHVMQNIKLANYEIPTPVQKYTIPIVLKSLDLMACAQTGSGKTASFMIPIFSHLMDNINNITRVRNNPIQIDSDGYGSFRYKATPLVLVMAPTRELTMQIFDECRRFTYRTMLRPCVIYGGASPISQAEQLKKGCDILIATPGRLTDFIQRGKVRIDKIKYLVLDEADRMLDMGFSNQLNQICQLGLSSSNVRQTMMFSATFPKPIRMLAMKYMKNFTFLAVGRVGGTTTDISQEIVYVEEKDKLNKLIEILTTQKPCRTLIFVNTKRKCDTLDNFLFEKGLPVTSIHGDRTQAEREDALLAFRLNKTPILIATAVAERGLDIKDVMHVINYDLSQTNIDEYVHRIGRTGRAGNKGKATSFYNDYCSDIAQDLTKLLIESKQKIPEFLEDYVPTKVEFEDINDKEYEEDYNNYIEKNKKQFESTKYSNTRQNDHHEPHRNQNDDNNDKWHNGDNNDTWNNDSKYDKQYTENDTWGNERKSGDTKAETGNSWENEKIGNSNGWNDQENGDSWGSQDNKESGW